MKALLADAGYYSEDNVASCAQSQIEAFIPPGRTAHNQLPSERFAQPAPLPENANPIDEMRHKLKIDEGRAVYAKRKSTVEPVFGIIGQSFLRGLEAVTGEWTLVSIAWNIKRMFALKG